MPHFTTDENYMRHALSLARRGLGRTWPNPSVGCVLVKDGYVIAAARTGDGGRPHAEAAALEQAGAQAKGATAYVTLEPCSHHGQTPPCAQALINAGVARVVIACEDPDERVSGEGVRILSGAPLEIVQGVCEGEALALNSGFFKRITQKRPCVTLKMAVSADEKIARTGERTQISGDAASQYMHLLRSQNDAILVGVETALTDNPMLTARLPGHNHKIVRCVMDRHLRLDKGSRLVQSAGGNPVVIFHEDGDKTKFEGAAVECVKLERVTPETVCRSLAERGITRLMVEGGATIASAFLKAELVDAFHLIRSGIEIGENGVDMLLDMNLENTLKVFNLNKKDTFNEDSLEVYIRKG